MYKDDYQALSFEDYLRMSQKERTDLWKKAIGNDQLRMYGRVLKILDTVAVVEDVYGISESHELVSIPHPLEFGFPLDEVVGLKNIADELVKKQIAVGDFIVFTVQVRSGNFSEDLDPILIKQGSITRMEDVQFFEDQLPIPEEKEQKYIFTDFIVNEAGELQYVSTPIKQLLEELREEIENLTAKKETITREAEKLTEKLEAKKHEQEKQLEIYKQQKLTAIEEEIANLERTKQKLQLYRLFLPDSERADVPTVHKPALQLTDINEALEHIQHYLLSKQDTPLYYEIDTLRQFYAGLKTDQLVVLAGNPGTGKSSLVGGFAEAISAEYRIIPIQPNWVDKSDLLGYYNPIEKTYISTPFLDAILEAKEEKNKEKLFIICLDEMNLSHVEYYFAEFLSKLQTDRTIELYSQNIKRDIENEIRVRFGYFEQSLTDLTIDEFLNKHNQKDVENYFQLMKQIQFLKQYEPILEIPRNIRFVGTLNKDETTKDLSPKVIDRSYFIWIDRFDHKKMTYIKQQIDDVEASQIPLKWNADALAIRKDEVSELIQKNFQALTAELENFNIHLTNRFTRTIEQLSAIDALNEEHLADIVIASLVLPKISADRYDTDVDQLLHILEKYITKTLKQSKKILNKMVVRENSDANGEVELITYWR